MVTTDDFNLHRMIKGFGGAHRNQRDSTINRGQGFVGDVEHDMKLEVGYKQSKVFNEAAAGPFWLSPGKIETQKNGIVLGQKEKDKVKHELIRDLRAMNIPAMGTKQICRS